jgi:5,10-methylenetetrahydrofolate reductase
VFEVDAVGLISLAAALNSGHTVGGGELGEGTDFAIGCVANPNAEDLEAEISRLEEKIAAGAHFVQTQPIFDVRAYERWANAIDGRVSIPILYGILPIKDAAFAVHLKENVPGMAVPDWVIDRMRSGGEGEGYRLAAELLSEIGKDIAGIHIFPMNSSKRVVGVLDALAEEGFAVPPVQTACDGLRKVAQNG